MNRIVQLLMQKLGENFATFPRKLKKKSQSNFRRSLFEIIKKNSKRFWKADMY